VEGVELHLVKTVAKTYSKENQQVHLYGDSHVDVHADAAMHVLLPGIDMRHCILLREEFNKHKIIPDH
jgi:hypothetical protein